MAPGVPPQVVNISWRPGSVSSGVDGVFTTLSSGKTLKFWNFFQAKKGSGTVSGGEARIEQGKKGIVPREVGELTCLTWSDDTVGRYLFAGSCDGKLVVFPREGGKPVQVFDLNERTGVWSIVRAKDVLWVGYGNGTVMSLSFVGVEEGGVDEPPPPPTTTTAEGFNQVQPEKIGKEPYIFTITSLTRLPDSIHDPSPSPTSSTKPMTVTPHPNENLWNRVRHIILPPGGGFVAGKEGGTLFYCPASGDGGEAPSTMKPVIISGGHAGSCTQVTTNPSPRQGLSSISFASVGKDSMCCLWSSTSNTPICRFRIGHPATGVAFSSDGSLLAVGCSSGYVKIFGMLSVGTSDPPTFLREHRTFCSDVDCVKFSPNGEYLAAGSHDNYIDIFSMLKGSFPRLRRLKGPTSYLTHIDFSIDGQLLMTNDGAGEILYFNVQEGKAVRSREEASSYILKTDGITTMVRYHWGGNVQERVVSSIMFSLASPSNSILQTSRIAFNTRLTITNDCLRRTSTIIHTGIP